MTKLSDEVQAALLAKVGGGKPIDPSKLDVSLDDIDGFGDKDSLREMFLDIAKYNKMLAERITFVNPSLSKAIPFTRENLYLICAYTGNGKSTIAANVSFPLYQQGKKTLVISNEESKQDILFRIGCLELGYNFNDWKKGFMPVSMQRDVLKLFPNISKFVKIIDVNYNSGLTTKVEGIKNALEAVKNEAAGYSAAMIDYYQLIQYSALEPARKRYDVLNDLRIFMGQYIKQSAIPIILFAQLHSIAKRNTKEMDSRIKECPTILEPSTVVIEVVPNFELKTSDFLIHKDRFGLAGHRVTCAFEKGKFVDITEDELQQRQLQVISEAASEDQDDDPKSEEDSDA